MLPIVLYDSAVWGVVQGWPRLHPRRNLIYYLAMIKITVFVRD